MAKVSQRTKKMHEKIKSESYKAIEAIQLMKETSTAKFVETAEAHINLRLDTKYADQQLRTTVILPKGSGKKVKIGVITREDRINEALKSGADIAGSEEFIQNIMKGVINFDKLIATPEMMPFIAKLGKILGPRGLMPSPKSGTVTSDLRTTIEEFRKGKLEYRADKSGIVHIPFGKVDFEVESLLTNLEAIQDSIDKNRPSGVKGQYWKSFYICSTMGPSISIDIPNFQGKIFS